jgi:hypothetical protein
MRYHPKIARGCRGARRPSLGRKTHARAHRIGLQARHHHVVAAAAGAKRAREWFEAVDHRPHGHGEHRDDGPSRGQSLRDSVAGFLPGGDSPDRVEQENGDGAIHGELAVRTGQAQDQAERPPVSPEHPQQDHVEPRLHVAAVGFHDPRGDARRREGQRQRGDRGEGRAESGFGDQDAREQCDGREIDGGQWRLQRRNRCAGQRHQWSRKPGLDRQHVGLAVEEQREGAALADVLGHQADDALIGIEVEPGPPHQRPRAKDHGGCERRE